MLPTWIWACESRTEVDFIPSQISHLFAASKRQKAVEGRDTKGELKDFPSSEMSTCYQSDENSKLRHGKGKIRDVKLKLSLIQSFTELDHSYIGASKQERPAAKKRWRGPFIFTNSLPGEGTQAAF